MTKFRCAVAGSTAVLLDCGDLTNALHVFTTLAIARDRGELHVDELVPAAETVLVRGGEAHDARLLAPKLRALMRAAGDTHTRALGIPDTVIPVHYRGEDLAEVETLTGLSRDQLVARHTAPHYTVAFTGFAPGFAYLSGGDPRLVVLRRATPRPRLLAGSVGLAGPFSGVYPRESPGGWQIIGFTEQQMWDLERDPPARLLAGGTVRFVAARETVRAAPPSPAPESALMGARSSTPTSPVVGRPILQVLEPGLQTLVEDAGRPGRAGMGVGESGAADRRAYRHANRLVGNHPGAAILELGHGSFAVRALATAVLALTGAERAGSISGPYGTRAAPRGVAFRLSAGEQLTLSAPSRGLRTTLALRGGVDAPLTLGSRARDTLAGLGPEALVAGTEIAAGTAGVLPVGLPESSGEYLPTGREETVLRVILGPRDEWFSAAAVAAFFRERWQVTPRSDRVGVRLSGPTLTRTAAKVGRELPSEGMVLGAIQVPPDGQPVLFLADRPLTGGYPVIAVVQDEDLDVAAQLAPGCPVRFVRSTEEAQAAPQPGGETR